MNGHNHAPMRRASALARFPRRMALAIAAALVLSAPAWAGEVCDTTQAGEDGDGSAASGTDAVACGHGRIGAVLEEPSRTACRKHNRVSGNYTMDTVLHDDGAGYPPVVPDEVRGKSVLPHADAGIRLSGTDERSRDSRPGGIPANM